VISQTAVNMVAPMKAGAVVTSHDASRLTTARLEGLSILFPGFYATDIGDVGAPGNGLWAYPGPGTLDVTIEGAGRDIWGTADSFTFVHKPQTGDAATDYVYVMSLQNTDPFAKVGVMIRDGLAPDAPHVVVDVKPNGEVEFMARLCPGCETTYLGGAAIAFGQNIRLSRLGNRFTAWAAGQIIGSVDVTMSSTVEVGFAVTSHVAGELTTAVVEEQET
jgi:hypothetical protein